MEAQLKERDCPPTQKNSPHWSHWCWLGNQIVRHHQSDWQIKEECHDRAHLEKTLVQLEQIRQEYIHKAASAQGRRKQDFEQGVRDKDEQIEYVRQRLEVLDRPAESIETVEPEETAMPKPVSVEIVEFEELSESEERDRHHLERRVERAVFEAGKALRELRDRQLYRSTHKSFEQYIKDRFGYSRYTAYNRIAAADVFDTLLTNGLQILPTKERQTRAIATLKDPDLQCEAWQLSVDEADGKVPSNRIVKDVVQRIRERTPVPNPNQVGEVCQILARDNPDLKGKGGCWCIVSQVHDWGCTVSTWDAEYQVRLEHLKSLDYSQEERQQIESLGVRMTLLHETGRLDEAALWVLKGLGKLTRPYLIPLEEKLLRVLESEYGVIVELVNPMSPCLLSRRCVEKI